MGMWANKEQSPNSGKKINNSTNTANGVEASICTSCNGEGCVQAAMAKGVFKLQWRRVCLSCNGETVVALCILDTPKERLELGGS